MSISTGPSPAGTTYRGEACQAAPSPDPILDRLRDLAETAKVNLDRAERIKCAVQHGPIPTGEEAGKPNLAGLEDIWDALRAAIYGIEERLLFIENKLGK